MRLSMTSSKNMHPSTHRIVFNGNGYSDEWVEEAARRGLPNITCMVDAIPVPDRAEDH